MAPDLESARGPGRPPDPELAALRRRTILQAATCQFAARGFRDADVQEIADALGVGKGTIYRYFPSKEALFLAAVDEGMQQLKAAIDTAAAAADSPWGRVEAAIRAYLTYFDQHPELIELLIQERCHFRDRKQPTYFVHCDANIRPWQDLLRQLISQGVVRDVPVERITDVISDLLYGTIFTNHFAGRRKSLASQCEDVLDILKHGVLACGGTSADV